MSSPDSRRCRLWRRRGVMPWIEWQGNRHDGSALRRGIDRDRPVMSLDDPLSRWQAEAGAAMLGGEERFEDPLANVRRDPGAMVGDRDPAHTLACVDADLNPARALRGL